MFGHEPSRAAVLAERGLRPYFVPDRRCAACGGWFEVEEGWWCGRCADAGRDAGYCDDCAEAHGKEVDHGRRVPRMAGRCPRDRG